MKLQRLQIREQDLHENIDDADLPWMNKEGHNVQSNTAGTGSISIPKIGSKVSFELQDDSLYHGKWTGAVNTSDVSVSELAADDYPNVYGHIDDSGNKLRVNTRTNEVSWTHISGGGFYFDGSGNLTINGSANFILNIIGNANILVQGNATLSSEGMTNILGSSVNINPSGPMPPTPVVARTRPS